MNDNPWRSSSLGLSLPQIQLSNPDRLVRLTHTSGSEPTGSPGLLIIRIIIEANLLKTMVLNHHFLTRPDGLSLTRAAQSCNLQLSILQTMFPELRVDLPCESFGSLAALNFLPGRLVHSDRAALTTHSHGVITPRSTFGAIPLNTDGTRERHIYI